jgi:hypothetical protein
MSADERRLERARRLARHTLKKPFSIGELLLLFEQRSEEP